MDKLLAPGIFRLFLAYVVVLHHLTVTSFGGWAVFVFFILSGYWITEVWRKKYSSKKQPYLHFITSRYFRLLPVYLTCFLLSALVLRLTAANFAYHAQLMQDFVWWEKLLSIVFANRHAFFLPPIWSIMVEMKFYLSAPFFIWMVTKLVERNNQVVRPAMRGILALGLIAVALLSIRSFLEFSDPALSNFLFYFLLGILVSATDYRPSRKLALASIGFVVLVMVLSFVSKDLNNLFGPDAGRPSNEYWVLMNRYMSGVLAILTIPYMSYSVRMPSDKLDGMLGNLSYPLYLFHFCIVFLFNNVPKLAHLPVSLRITLSVLAMSAGALLIYYLVDRPAEKLRRKWLEA